MDTLKITTMAKRKFSGLYDIRIYKKHLHEQCSVVSYKFDSEKIIVDGK